MLKIKPLKELKKTVSSLKSKGKKIVLCHGVFDLIHLGHIKYFNAAKKYGDVLVVSITIDKFVNKGIGRPFFNHNNRAEVLAALDAVDYVTFGEKASSLDIIKELKPNFYAKGIEYKDIKNDSTKKIISEVKEIKKNNGKIIYIDEKVFSSSNIINKSSQIFNEDQKKFLKKISKKYSFNEIQNYLYKLNKLKTLVIGETIIDEYVYCNPLGKSGKEPYLAFKELYDEKYLGGAAAIARQMREFATKIDMISMIGQNNKYLSFIKKNLPKDIGSVFIKKKDSPTILKRRYVDQISGHKIFGTYLINDIDLEKKDDDKLLKVIKSKARKSNLILISDYGHGFISKNVANRICKLNCFISLNAQINAANVPHHTLQKYQKVDAMIINRQELIHEMRDKNTSIVKLAKIFIKKMKIKNLVITMGKVGAILVTEKGKHIYCPAFAKNVVDKVGAGDAMLSLLSLCLINNVPKDLSLFLGSIVGGLSVQIIGNKKSVNFKKLIRTIEFAIK
tara:strand:- start:2369 stop:3886 length:1518 start_codon:yes stop_codon:yes gene_type:complete